MTAPRGEQAGPLVTVIIPTHNHANTVDLAARSVLTQSVRSLELVVIGDGASPEVKEAVEPLLSDTRVRYIERPKSASRGELVRRKVLAQATSPYVCYLGDDDLMLEEHLAVTLRRLQEVDFTHPLPVFVDRQGLLKSHDTDLADPRCRTWHLHPLRNAVSLTGVGHRLDAYRRLPHGWQEAPAGRWSDHFMWQQWFTTGGFRYATGETLTVLKFEGSVRNDMAGPQRRQEIVRWVEFSRQPGFDAWLAHQVADAFRRSAIDLRLAVDEQADRFEMEREHEAERHGRRVAESDENARVSAAERRAAEAELSAMRATRTWRLRGRLIGSPGLRRLLGN